LSNQGAGLSNIGPILRLKTRCGFAGGGFDKGHDHVLFTLYARTPELLEEWSVRLAELYETGGAFQELWRQDAAALIEKVSGIPTPVAKVHFGYVDGIADPTIKGGPEGNMPEFRVDASIPNEFAKSAAEGTFDELCEMGYSFLYTESHLI
jgi:hypothetical protein